MIVRCGNCRTQFDVPGPGRFGCPVCGSVNMVRSAADAGAPPPMSAAAPPQSPPPAAPSPPSPRISCPECDFSFIVGAIAVATCPNCGAEVTTGYDVPAEGD